MTPSPSSSSLPYHGVILEPVPVHVGEDLVEIGDGLLRSDRYEQLLHHAHGMVRKVQDGGYLLLGYFDPLGDVDLGWQDEYEGGDWIGWAVKG